MVLEMMGRISLEIMDLNIGFHASIIPYFSLDSKGKDDFIFSDAEPAVFDQNFIVIIFDVLEIIELNADNERGIVAQSGIFG